MTSTWSERKPMGTITTSVVPSAASSTRASFTSGSSQGVAGDPLRDWYTSRQGGTSTPAWRAAPAMAAFATTRCWATYIPGSPDSGIGHSGSGPDVLAMDDGMEWVVKSTNGRRPGSASTGASSSAVASANQPNSANGGTLTTSTSSSGCSASATPTSSRY